MTKAIIAAPDAVAGLATVLAIGSGGRVTRGSAREAASGRPAAQAAPAPDIIDGRLDPQDIPNSTRLPPLAVGRVGVQDRGGGARGAD